MSQDHKPSLAKAKLQVNFKQIETARGKMAKSGGYQSNRNESEKLIVFSLAQGYWWDIRASGKHHSYVTTEETTNPEPQCSNYDDDNNLNIDTGLFAIMRNITT